MWEGRISFAVGPGPARTRFSASLHPCSHGLGVRGDTWAAPKSLYLSPSVPTALPVMGTVALCAGPGVRRLRSCLALPCIHLLVFRGYRGDVIDDDDGNRGDRWQINS